MKQQVVQVVHLVNGTSLQGDKARLNRSRSPPVCIVLGRMQTGGTPNAEPAAGVAVLVAAAASATAAVVLVAVLVEESVQEARSRSCTPTSHL